MSCYYPIDGWRAKSPNNRGRYPIVFKPGEAQQDAPIKLPCGRCIGCRLEKSRQWALRCSHEAQLHKQNSFITLTYDQEHLPEHGNLHKKPWQDFMKALRHYIYPQKVRYFMCGEYGENRDLLLDTTLGRPHYHGILFGYQFNDLEQISENHHGDPLYKSKELDELWPNGMSAIGQVTFESAAYVARYCTKKINGEAADDHYTKTNKITGESIRLNPEFTLMSRRPGIAHDWFLKYKQDLAKGFITHKGQKMQPPEYYNRLQEIHDLDSYEQNKRNRENEIDLLDPDNTLDRLRVKEQIKLNRAKQLQRPL